MALLAPDRGVFRISLICSEGPTIEITYDGLRRTPAGNAITQLHHAVDNRTASSDDATELVDMLGRISRRLGERVFSLDYRNIRVISTNGWAYLERALLKYAPDNATRESFLALARSGAPIEIRITDPLPLTPEEQAVDPS